jgi:hypothetical protein
MLGLEDFWIVSAYVLCVASALGCLVYGIICWNKGGEIAEIDNGSWEKEEEEVKESL